ncbi:undecaprenyl-phosphate glycosyltransferase, putative [Syntrophotalea carbinolica DSM 2380]|uniref:Undecaprenyl-phosphate glycosyltransferase, putative n=1 Tax=Syntrophotalea carbinolica (strain DSM 2380 / NBRC 103641 / GraBd1) TaxID=338963 RepID=Q3A8I5_SYNC1|nr:undecaprenyl-phosphate glycosyltransferase, putative [Syntrophotalea carbinolica DSM 2380]
MTKLIIQIPCYNEEQTLEIALRQLPRSLPGIDCVEWLIIDDGSTDRTVEVARACGVDHIVSHPRNLGLARAFMTGLEAALKAGADIIVNTDADNQYEASDIPKLLEPILQQRAELVIGARPISTTEHFSPIKKLLQKFGSWVVRQASGTAVDDAPSGFRAISRTAATRLVVFNRYTYTLETIIQAGRQGMAIASVPIRTNEDLRPSRLVKSIRSYVQRSLQTILRISVIYSPGRFFAALAVLAGLAGVFFMGRFGWFFLQGAEDSHVPSVVLGLAGMGAALLLAIVGILADLLAVNRKLLEDVRRRLIELSLDGAASKPPCDATQRVASPLPADTKATGSNTQTPCSPKQPL